MADAASEALGQTLRHEYGRVVAALLREFGGARLALIEDALGQAMLEALVAWARPGPPPSPRAWLHRAARHRLLDELRRARRLESLLTERPHTEPLAALREGELGTDATEPSLADDVHDDELRALFACADPSIPLASQLVFALRTLAGFSTREIAARLVTSEENVQKRFERAREAFRSIDVRAELTGEALVERSHRVLRMLYVLFTEGYFASSGPTPLKLELCREALRLCTLIVRHPRLVTSEALALLALMHLHHGRRDARVDAEGQPVLLEAQDRARYRLDELVLGLQLLRQASERAGDEAHDAEESTAHAPRLTSVWHFEAAIAAEHAFAPSITQTRWDMIVRLYDRLAALDPSPLHALHGAIALSYALGPDAGLARLAAMQPPTWLLGSHLWLATHADLHGRAGRVDLAIDFYDKAIALAPPLERAVLCARRQTCLSTPR